MSLQFVYPIHQLPHNCRVVEEKCEGSVCRRSEGNVCRKSVRGVCGGEVCREVCGGGVCREVTVVQLYAESDCFFTHVQPTLTTERLNG